jgi:hypothetical protein
MEGIKVKGCMRLQIDEDGVIVGDSGWHKNIVTTGGFQNIQNLIGTSLTGTQWSHANVGTNAAPASNATALPSEVIGTGGIVVRAAVTAATQALSKTLRFTATLASSASFISDVAGETINNVGLFAHSTTDNLQAGLSYAASTCATNQNVNITYDLVFETA